MELISLVTCPACAYKALEPMPTDACLYIYDCKGCGHRMKPIKGKCCVFCSYGSVPCPPVQGGDCCIAQRRDLVDGVAHTPADVVVAALYFGLLVQAPQPIED